MTTTNTTTTKTKTTAAAVSPASKAKADRAAVKAADRKHYEKAREVADAAARELVASQKTIDEKIAGWEAKAKADAYSVEEMVAEMVADDAVAVKEPTVNLDRPMTGTVTQVFPDNAKTVEEVVEAPAVKPERKPSTKANSGHAYAILGAYRTAKRSGLDPMAAMREEVDSIPAAIRGAAVKLAMKHDDPNGACQTFLKALHAEQPTAPKATKAKTRGPFEGDTLTVRKNNEELCVRWLGSDRIGQTFTQMRVVVDGKLIITLTQA